MQILYDSKCGFCQAFIDKLPAMNVTQNSLYDLRSREARQLLKSKDVQFITMNTIYCIDEATVAKKSKAIFRIFHQAKKPYRYLYLFNSLPVAITDYFYDLVAKNRYAISKFLRKLKLLK